MSTPAGSGPRPCHPSAGRRSGAGSAATGAAAHRDRCFGAMSDGSRGRRLGRCHIPPPMGQGQRECSPVEPPLGFRLCERPGSALHPPQKVHGSHPSGRHQCKRCSVHRGFALVGRRPGAPSSGDGRSPSTSPVGGESDCCASRSSPARLPRPRPCPAAVQRQHRLASHIRADVPIANDRSSGAVDPQHGGSPVPSHSERP